jgi:branched-chain amino acid transport system substrate-binding protein
MRRTLVLAVATVTLGLLTACSEPESATSPSSSAEDTRGAACAGLDLLACARLGTLAGLVPDAPTAATGEPIRLGMVNQENTPVGSFPELSAAAQAAATFVNEQLGGAAGRPIEIEVCNTNFSAEGSTACGQQFAEAGVPAVLGGIDIFGNAVDVLDANGIPYVGGIPVSAQSVSAPNSFQWSGGTWGAAVAFAEWATTELDAKSVSIVYGEFGSIADSADYGRTVLESRGVATQMVPYPIVTTDLTSPLTAATSTGPDAVVVLAADTGCKAAFDAVRTLGVSVPVFYVGACAAPTIVDSVPVEATEGALFNVEGNVSTTNPDPDFALYAKVLETYGDGLNPVGASTVSFRAFMNLFAVLSGLDAEPAADTVAGALAAQRNTPSFMGHPYTCDRKQFEGLPAMCSPQQIMVQMRDREVIQISDWIDVGAIYAASL